MAHPTYIHSDVSSYSGSSEEEGDVYSGDEHDKSIHSSPPPVVLPLDCFYKKVLSDLLVSRNDSFFNYAFEQIFSRKLKANINGVKVSFDELRLHFLSLRKAYYASSSSSSSSSSSIPSSSSPFSPDASLLKFGPFLSSDTNGGREGYLAAHTVLANLINNPSWENSPLLLSVPLASPSSSPSSSEDDAEDEKEHDVDLTPRRKRVRSSISASSISNNNICGHHTANASTSKLLSSSSSSSSPHRRIKYNALVVTDTMEIQWMEGKDGECRKITKFDRIIKRPVSKSPSSSLSSSSSSSKSVKHRRL